MDQATPPVPTTQTTPAVTPPILPEDFNPAGSVQTPTPPPEVTEMQFVPKPPPPPPPKPRRSFIGIVVNIFLLIILFGVGIWLSSFLRQYLPKNITNQLPNLTVSPSPAIAEATPAPANPFATWISYQAINGITRQAVVGISYMLPPDVLAPVCDSTNCPSQGTYLPGGTRFTIAYRGPGQVLRDFRGAVITDLSGHAFDTKPATVAGKTGLEYSGTFVGSTVAGYSFSQMHGFMVEVSDTTSLEINHFTPTGITADFSGDDKIFNLIVSTVDFSGTSAGIQKGAIIPASSIAPTAIPTASSSPGVTTTPNATPTLNYLY